MLHGFAQESTRTTLVPTRQDLKEQDEASRAQPRSARGQALHGFAQESTQTTLVPARQDLKEQDEASSAQPRSARGLVDTRPTGYPIGKGEDLV